MSKLLRGLSMMSRFFLDVKSGDQYIVFDVLQGSIGRTFFTSGKLDITFGILTTGQYL